METQTSVRSTLRQLGDQRFIYAVNCSLTQEADLQFDGDFAGFLSLDLETGKLTPLPAQLHFEPDQSYVLFLTWEEAAPEEERQILTLPGPFRIQECSDNYLTLDQAGKTLLDLPGNYARCALQINGQPVEMSYFGHSADVSKHLKAGENVARIMLYSGNRNLLGPHHNAREEDPMYVPPRSFELPLSWKDGRSEKERSNYSFVRFGLHAESKP